MSDTSSNKPVIGIVGGVAAGKSTVASELAKLGCAVVDADAIGHELLRRRDVQKLLRDRWGEAIFKPAGSVDRNKLAEIVFADPAELAALNEIMHPRIKQRIVEQIDLAGDEPSVKAVALDAAVMLEARWDDLCTHRIFVSCPEAERLARASIRPGWDADDWRRREESQKLLDNKLLMCDYTIENSSSVSHLAEQTREIFIRIISRL